MVMFGKSEGRLVVLKHADYLNDYKCSDEVHIVCAKGPDPRAVGRMTNKPEYSATLTSIA